VNAAGAIAGVTTTSGLAWKIPGRVGDSPILGAGLYVDGDAGAAGSTGRGEANLFGLSSFLVVEGLRRGMHPKDAGMEALRRIRSSTVERRLLKDDGNPSFNVSFYILDRQGRHAGVALYGEDDEERGWAGQTEGRVVRYSICTENGAETLPCEPLLPGAPQG
jgi:N4-(beta-N-acetylglucosaminyl)-L-asparaginase